MSRSVAVSLSGTAATALGASVFQLWYPGRPGRILPEDGWTTGQSTLRRSTVDSQYIRGRLLVDAVEDVRTATVNVLCMATSGAELRTLADQVRIALRQWSYTMQWDYDGFVSNWQCEPADLTFGDGGAAVDEFGLSFYDQVVTATIPYSTTDGAL